MAMTVPPEPPVGPSLAAAMASNEPGEVEKVMALVISIGQNHQTAL
jgi:hypothetical protein